MDGGDSVSDSSIVVLVLAVASAVAAAVAAIASWVQAARAAQSNEVGVFLEMQAAYGTPEMRQAVSALAKFWRENRAIGLETSFLDIRQNDPHRAAEIRGHSRHLSGYFTNVGRLYEARLISKKLARLLALHPGLNVFYDVAVPINRVSNPHHNSIQYAAILKRLAERHGNGVY